MSEPARKPIANLTDEELEQKKLETERYLKLARKTGIYNCSALDELIERLTHGENR